MKAICDYLEMIGQIQERMPEKEAICINGTSITYRELFLMAKNEQKKLPPTDRKQLYAIRSVRILEQLIAFLACQGTNYIPVILAKDGILPEGWQQMELPENACMAVMTSGTSGKSKLLFRTFESWHAYFPVQNEIFHISEKSRLFMQGSLAFTGNLNLYLGQLSAGATILAEERFDPRIWIKEIRTYHGDGIYLIPTKLQALYQALKHEGEIIIPQVVTILTGSQSLGKKEAEELKQFFPEAEITLYYGASELSYVTYIRGSEMNEDKTRIGIPFPDVKVWTEKGKLMVDTAYGIIGTEKKATAGDHAHLDEEGYFCFDGRKDDICNINGRKISMVQVEQALLKLEIVEQAAVKVIEKNERDCLAAWIVLKEKKEADSGNISLTVRKLLKNKLPENAIPKFVFVMDSLPVNESGKVLKRALQAK